MDSGRLSVMLWGQEKRRVFTKKSEQYEAVLGAMKRPLSREDKEEILEKYFNS